MMMFVSQVLSTMRTYEERFNIVLGEVFLFDWW